MIATLQEEFVCSWLLAKDLEAIAARAGDPDLTELCQKIRANYGYPVDSVLLSADLEVVGHLNVNEPAATDPDGYLAFLRRGLVAAGREPSAEPVAAHDEQHRASRRGPASLPPMKLTREAPSASVLDLFRKGGLGEFSMMFLSIDHTAFEQGGTLTLELRVGSGAADGRFEICTTTPDAPNAMTPTKSVVVPAGESRRVDFPFAAGVRVGLAVNPGDDAAVGDMNAFLATLTIREG